MPTTPEVATPNLDALVKAGIDLNRHYVYKYCSPSRSALQSGRNPYHVNPLNAAPDISNAADPVSGFAAIPRNMTGVATKMKAAGYSTALFGKWDAGMATPDHTPRGRGYDVALNYFHHANDYWSMQTGNCPIGEDKLPVIDLWRTTPAGDAPARVRAANNRIATDRSIDDVGVTSRARGGDETRKECICLLYTSPSPRDQRGSGVTG